MTTSLEDVNKYVWPEKKWKCRVQCHRMRFYVLLLEFSGEIGCYNSKSGHSENVLEMEEQSDYKSKGKQNEWDNCHWD